MKSFLTFSIILFMSFSIFGQDNKPEFKFEKETINYGTIAQGADGKRIFEFTNVGKSPLIISNIKSSCGCTVPSWTKEPIMPGDKGKIEVSYNTKKLGGFSKAITIYSNAKNPRKTVKIRGIVEKISLENSKSILSEETL